MPAGPATPLPREAPAVGDRNGGNRAGAAHERAIAASIARRAVIVAPVAVGIGAAVWGWSGVWSVGLALGLVVANFAAGAAVIAWGSRCSPAALVGAVLGGYVVRLAAITAVVLPLRTSGWFEPVPFGAALILSHLGLLVWEARHVVASLGLPALRQGHEIRSPRGFARRSTR